MEREARSFAYGELPDGYILRSRLGQVIGMIKWNERRLKELVRKMGCRRTPGQRKTPIHLTLYGCLPYTPWPLLTRIMQLDATAWSTLGYDETDRVSVIRYLGSLGCRTEGTLRDAAYNQRPLTLELARLLVSVGCDPTAHDYEGRDALVSLAASGHPADPQVTDLFLSAGCRTNLDGCKSIFDEQRLRFDQILKEHAEWKESLSRMSAENSPADPTYGPDWSR